jgi:hypothetical protein
MESKAACPTIDPELPMLEEALDRGRMEERLRPMIREAGALESIRLVKHRPGRRCVVAYEFAGSPAGGDPRSLILFGKIRRKGTDWRTHELLRTLCAKGLRAGADDCVSVPEPVGVVPELRMVVQRAAPGEPASELLFREDAVARMAGVAAAIHSLHQHGPRVDRRHSLADEIAILEDRLAALRIRRPAWAPRLARVLDACQRLAGRLESPRTTGVHRDFYADQILVDGEHFTLIDLDLYAMGDPALDVGNFAGHLTELSLRTTGDPDALADREQSLFDCYRALRTDVTEDALRDYATLTLVRHVSISSTMPDRTHATADLLDLCEQRLELSPL